MSIKLQTRSKLRHTPYRLYTTLAGSFAVFSVAFLAAFWASSIFAPINVSDASTQVSLRISNTNYYVETTSHDIDLSLNATPTGALTVGKDTITTKTNCNGYRLYLSSAIPGTTSIMNPSTHVVESVANNSLILEGSDETAGDWLPVTQGKFTSAAGGPQAFKDNINDNIDTWGFAVPSGSTGLPSAAGSFDATYGTTAEGNVNLENKFAELPSYSTPVLIQETNSSNETGVDLDVYYGVYASSNKTAGIYSGELLYSILGKDTSTNARVTPSTITNLGSNSAITIITPILTNGAVGNSDVSVTVGGETCTVIGTSITNTSGEPDNLKIVCNAPDVTTVGGLGTYDVVANVTKFGQSFTINNGVTYSLGGTQITSVSPANSQTNQVETLTISTDLTTTGITASDITATLTNTSTSTPISCPILTDGTGITYNGTNLVVRCAKPANIAGGIYDVSITIAGQTITANNAFQTVPAFWTITTMQEMTPEVCNSVYAPAAYTTYTGTAPVIINKAAAEAGGYTATADGTAQVPETTLIDYRGIDGTGTSANKVLTGNNVRTYTVRKLADGNCWMTEHLALPLVVGTGVEASYGTTTAASISTFSYTPTSNASIGSNTITPRVSSDAWNGYYYYNWYAATAEQGTASTAAGVDINGSICPKGWRLPANYTISTTLSWGALTNAYGITVNGANTSTSTGYLYLEASPLSVPRSGYYGNGRFGDGGVRGYYWSSTAPSVSGAYLLYFDSSLVYPQNSGGKSANGFSIRCLAVR